MTQSNRSLIDLLKTAETDYRNMYVIGKNRYFFEQAEKVKAALSSEISLNEIIRKHELMAPLVRALEALPQAHIRMPDKDVSGSVSGESAWYANMEDVIPLVRDYRVPQATEPVSGEHCYDCDGLQAEISEIVRVARDNPAGLQEFLQMNFPREWVPVSSSLGNRVMYEDGTPSREYEEQPVGLTQSDTVTNAWLLLKQCEGESMAEDRPRVDAAYRILERIVHARKCEPQQPDDCMAAFEAIFKEHSPELLEDPDTLNEERHYFTLGWNARPTERESIDLKEVRLLALAALGILPDELTCTPEEVKQDAIVIARTAKKYI